MAYEIRVCFLCGKCRKQEVIFKRGTDLNVILNKIIHKLPEYGLDKSSNWCLKCILEKKNSKE